MQQGELKTIENKQFEKGAWSQYPTVYIKHPNAEVKPYQFTENDLIEARKRAIKNIKDIPPLDNKNTSLIMLLIYGFTIGFLASFVLRTIGV